MAAPSTTRQFDAPAIDAFAARIRGEVITPNDPLYPEARTVYNAMIDKHPALVAQCQDAADVINAVRFGRENDLQIAVRGGGHNVAGKGAVDDGLVIDLSMMRGVRVDPQARTARVEGGALWGDVDHATHEFGLATPSGIISTTGVGGLTLGGGFGHIARQFGLSCDNLIEADVVTAAGELVKASEQENPDLFWALRGGGGNFGIVTSFKFRLHPVKNIYGGLLVYPVERARELLNFYRDYIPDAARDVSMFFAFHQGPPAPFIPEHLHLKPMAALAVCYSGAMDRAEEAVKPIREAVEADGDILQEMPYPAIQSMFDPLYPPGMQHYWKADYINELPDGAVEQHVRRGPTVPNVQSGMHLYPLNGAIHDVAPEATAFSYRDALANHNIIAVYEDPADTPARIQWVRDYWDALRPYSAGGGYVNFMTDEGDERIKTAYRDNYPRLVEIKRKWDPDNVFRVNQNIKP